MAIVALLGVSAEVVHHTVGSNSPLVPLLSLSEGANLPTWYSSMLLFSCAAALAAIAIEVRRSGGRFIRHWAVLAVVLTPIAAIATRVTGRLRAQVSTSTSPI